MIYNDNIFMEDYQIPTALPSKEVYILIEKAQAGDKEARDKVIEHNLRLVAMVVREFDDTPYEFNDLFSYGIIGLIKGVDNYDSTKGYKFTSFFVKCIRNSICTFLIHENKSIKAISINTSLDKEKNDYKETTIADLVEDENANISKLYEEKETSIILSHLVNELPEKEARCIKLYFGIGTNISLTQEQIASKYNVTRQCINKIIIKGLKELREKAIIEFPDEVPTSINKKLNK